MPALSPTLAQFSDLINAPVPPLPEPGALHRYLFEQPLLPTIVLGIAAVLIFFTLRGAGKPGKGALAAGIAALAAAGIWATAGMVETKRERLLTAQDRLIASVADADIGALDDLLSPDARIRPSSLPMLSAGLSRGLILRAVEQTTGKAYPVTSHSALERQAVIDGPNSARTQAYIRVESSAGGTAWTWFAMVWRLGDDDAWRAVEIEPLYISGGVLPYKER